ncbi:hypothetical protein FRC18_007176, partial [Serendipita sp. 400]
MEDNAWSAWRRASDTTTLVPTRRPSQFTRRMTDSPTPGDGLRPPSPQLRTKAFRPGWANARRNKLQKENNASTDSLDNDMRRSMEVRFTRGLSFDDSDAANGEDGSDVDRDSIYLHSPPKKTKPLGVPSSSLLFSNDEIHKPVARYAFDQPNAQSQRSPTGQHFVAGQRTNQNQWYTMNNQQHSHSVAQPSSKRTEMVPPSNFARLKAAVAEEQEKDSFLTDPLGRAISAKARNTPNNLYSTNVASSSSPAVGKLRCKNQKRSYSELSITHTDTSNTCILLSRRPEQCISRLKAYNIQRDAQCSRFYSSGVRVSSTYKAYDGRREFATKPKRVKPPRSDSYAANRTILVSPWRGPPTFLHALAFVREIEAKYGKVWWAGLEKDRANPYEYKPRIVVIFEDAKSVSKIPGFAFRSVNEPMDADVSPSSSRGGETGATTLTPL